MANRSADTTCQILGLPFSCGGVSAVAARVLASRGVVAVPSAPCLRIATCDAKYYRDLKESALLVPDSGAMILFARLRGLPVPERVSGPALFQYLFTHTDFGKAGCFLVNPSDAEGELNVRMLAKKGRVIVPENHYTAPRYALPQVEDAVLLERLRKRRPRVVIINLGGGVQERLAAWLQREWLATEGPDELPTFLCTGAAIAFATGAQGAIPGWAERLYLGWAVRCVQAPQRYIPRYAKALPLLWDILRFGRDAPF